ncbi:MAG TPA: hypothetical protein VM536_12705, partial [Chloroflexia bacterium]|nr:hypothetical protein [Chloroflexia bacterium]
LGPPLLAYPGVAGTLLTAYEPQALAGDLLTIQDWSDLRDPLPVAGHPGGALWLANIPIGGLDRIEGQLRAGGYQRVMHQYYWNPLYLDLYLQPGTRIGEDLRVNGTFAGDATQAVGWALPPAGASFAPAEGGRQLLLTNRGPSELRATQTLRAYPHRGYLVHFEAQAELQAGAVRSFLLCEARAHRLLHVAPDAQGADVPHDRAWHAVDIAVLCPAETSALVVDLRNAGQGIAAFRHVTLQAISLNP